MEEHGISADLNTYKWLLEGCLTTGALVDAKRVHCKILKLGLDEEPVLGSRLIEMYANFGDVRDTIHLFDKISQKSVSCWNGILTALLAKAMNWQAIHFFLRNLKDGLCPDRVAFCTALRACSGSNVHFSLVQQIHAKVFRYGFSSDAIVCNPLIDLYAKNGRIGLAHLLFEGLCSRDSVSWVAMISGFSQNGYGVEALFLFSQLKMTGVKPTPYVFSSVLSACTKTEYTDLGKQLHADVLKWGFLSETFVGNALINLYSRSGEWNSAEQIFLDMLHHDAVTYNSLISGHSQGGKSDKALHFFQKMQSLGLKPDAVTIASLLSACATLGALDKGKQLHAYVFKSGISSDIIIEGSVLDLYVKCSDVDTAHEFFNTANKENVVLWNVMLVAYGQLGNLTESFNLFYQMQYAGVNPNQYTYPSILRTCTSLGALDLGEQIHTHVIKTGFEQNVYLSSVLIDMYAKCGKLNIARGILERVTEDDVVSWTAMIAGYAQHELCVEALKLFEEMQKRGILADNIGLSSALSACAGIQALKQGSQIHCQAFVLGYFKDLSIGNSLVSLYARCGRVKEAKCAFEAVEKKDQITWNALISGFAQSGHYEEALSVFSLMNEAEVEANVFTYGPTVSAAANITDMKLGKQIHARIIKTGHESEIEAGNALITLYAKCGVLQEAQRGFFDMSERNEISWNAIITGYSQHGCGKEALRFFEMMKEGGFKPNHVTFVGVLSACSHVGLVEEGLNYFKSMSEEHDIIPRAEHYACVVDILGRAGLVDHAKGIIKQMPMDPDAMVWRTLLSACTVHRNMEIGELAASHLLELEPKDSASYVLLSNIYAVAKKWVLRDKVRQMMKDRGVKKEPGRSWIEVKNSVHAFFVGDKLHPLTDKIYEKLEDVTLKIAENGYVQDRYSLLNDDEQEQKDPSIFVHSEKLAISFALISLSTELPIRVFKNLRVCNDCHNWIKFVSKISGRVVIVRDAYRFHHFSDGACSCGDYW
ncbi:pentatricopeptide repeat-containing protein At4g13650 [Aristolochia californica]|uniref:pentatricopeptide repeat-containing protein At4g13650 n=1 Tax=Aristolochia californica TaxID=171875 RepID=UPI0035DB667A